MRKLPPITQLYVSVDAGNKKDLEAVDRPLFSDFWERYLACLDILRSVNTVHSLSVALRCPTDKLN